MLRVSSDDIAMVEFFDHTHQRDQNASPPIKPSCRIFASSI